LKRIAALQSKKGDFEMPVAIKRSAKTDLPYGYVYTPGGPRDAKLVHHVKRGEKLRVEAGRIKHLDSRGSVFRDYGLVERLPGKRLQPARFAALRGDLPGLGDNWITAAEWFNNTGVPISLFKTTWTVPQVPLTRDDQLVYIFNAIQNSTMIFQPVLQWGESPAGGGGRWAVASWYADGAHGHAFHSDLITVQTDDVLVGTMTLLAQAGSAFDYICEFENISGTALPIQNVEELKLATETLEAYSLNRASNYPTRRIQMRSIELLTGGNPAPTNWTVNDIVTDTGQETSILSGSTTGSGEVDLFCFGAKAICLVPNTQERVELLYTIVDDAIYRKFMLSPPNDWSDDEPLSSHVYAKQITAGINKLGLLETFYVGDNNDLYHDWQIEGFGWIGEQRLNGASAKQVTVGTNEDRRLEVFYVGLNDKIYHNWQLPAGGWSGENWLGGFAKQLVAVSNDDDRIELLYIGTNESLFHNWQTIKNGGWNGEFAFGGQAKVIAACLDGLRRILMVYIGTNDVLFMNQQTERNNGWSGELTIGDTAQAIAVCTNANGKVQLVYVDQNNNQVCSRQQDRAGGTFLPVTQPGFTAVQVALALNSSNLLDLVMIGTDGMLYHSQQSSPGGPWAPASFL
jgi:hypothetical protein